MSIVLSAGDKVDSINGAFDALKAVELEKLRSATSTATVVLDVHAGDEELLEDDVGESDDEEEAVKRSYRDLAERLCCQKVELVVDHKSEDVLSGALRGTLALTSSLPENTWRGVIYDSKTNGESITAPWRRLPPLKQPHLQKTIQSLLKALKGEAYTLDATCLDIDPSTIFMFFDAMKHQHQKPFVGLFLQIKRGWRCQA